MKLRMHLFVLPLIFSLLCSFCIRAAASDLEVGHWAYDYLERMKVKGVVSGFLNQTLPGQAIPGFHPLSALNWNGCSWSSPRSSARKIGQKPAGIVTWSNFRTMIGV